MTQADKIQKLKFQIKDLEAKLANAEKRINDKKLCFETEEAYNRCKNDGTVYAYCFGYISTYVDEAYQIVSEMSKILNQ